MRVHRHRRPNSLTSWATIGIRDEPPTSSTECSSSGVHPADRSARFTPRYMDFETILRKAVERLDGGHYVRGLAYMHLVALSAYGAAHPRRRPGRHNRGGVA
jgi:hypothetical protein